MAAGPVVVSFAGAPRYADPVDSLVEEVCREVREDRRGGARKKVRKRVRSFFRAGCRGVPGAIVHEAHVFEDSSRLWRAVCHAVGLDPGPVTPEALSVGRPRLAVSAYCFRMCPVVYH